MILTTSILLFSLVTSGLTAFADTNVVYAKDAIKVFVGAISQNSAFTRNSFVNNRNSFIINAAEDLPNKSEVALITFNQYLTLEEADTFVAALGDCQIKEIFLGIPNIDGRSIIGKAGSNIVSERVEENFASMIAEETDEVMKNELLNYQKNSKVFAITVETSNQQIADANRMESVRFVDTYNYPEAEQKAQRKNVPVSYIALPEKPDNAK